MTDLSLSMTEVLRKRLEEAESSLTTAQGDITTVDGRVDDSITEINDFINKYELSPFIAQETPNGIVQTFTFQDRNELITEFTDTVLVTVNGVIQTLTTDYTVNAGAGRIVFETGHEPPADSVVHCFYTGDISLAW